MSKIIIAILVFLLILTWSNYNKAKEEISDFQARNGYLEGQLYEYQSALEEANNNIDEANSYIEDTQSYAWTSYQEMGEALENLTTVDTVSEP